MDYSDSYFPFQVYGIVVIVIGSLASLAIIAACIWFATRARRPDEHSKIIGVNITPGEVVSPLTTGPHLQYQSLAVSLAVPATYATNAIAGGEELVLVPRSMLSQQGYIQRPPHPQQQPAYYNRMSMDAIREESGVYLAQPSPPYSVQQQHTSVTRASGPIRASRVESEADATELSEVAIYESVASGANSNGVSSHRG
ncbi:hypothetical protein EDD21DRAFT_372103 [Dissophora ornata]|nr:hypothetical protein EDD21DRAFT_372103 [Dissophora ornata]